ncbi:MAG: ATP-binding protein [Chitinivibrionia bacterium]|nr:ATP-binding protein [Chitinivibrionia bacterium]
MIACGIRQPYNTAYMQSGDEPFMNRHPSSRKRAYLLSGLLGALLIVFNVSTYTLYERAKVHLDGELGERLQSIASILGRSVEVAARDSLSNAAADPVLYSLLHTAKTENLLTNILVLTPDGRTVVDIAGISNPGEYNPFIDLDYSAVALARSGFPASTSLYKSGDVFMKSAYAPLHDSREDVAGILGIEAGADYFVVLKSLRGAITLVDAASIAVILLLGLLFYRQSISLDRAHDAVVQSENLAAMGRMVAGIAHEIRNPLSIIKTSAERIQKQYGIEDEIFTYISEEVDELNRILTGYLNFARSEPHDVQRHSLQKILVRCLLLIESDAELKQISFAHSLPEEELFVECDDKRMQQAFLNILLNAVQAVEAGGRIELTAHRKGGAASVTVRDNGCGMSEKTLREIFKPFYTTKKHGSGLGLSIVKNIVDAHGGSVGVASTPGAGTAVTVSMPLCASETKPAINMKEPS